MRRFTSIASPRLALCLLALGAACSSSSDGPTAPALTEAASLTVNASTATAFVALGPAPRLVTGGDTASAAAWDIAFNATNVLLNTAGSVTAHCLCQHEADTDAAIMTLTAGAELATFDAVTAARIPAESSFSPDAFAAHKWYRYNLTGEDHQIWPTFDVFLIRRGSAIYKLQVTGYYDAAGNSRHVSIRSAQLRS